MSTEDGEGDGGDLSLFKEPEDFYQPEREPTFASHRLRDGKEVNIRLVGHNPLWVGFLSARPNLVSRTHSEKTISSLLFQLKLW